jgi:hypothetical protein
MEQTKEYWIDRQKRLLSGMKVSGEDTFDSLKKKIEEFD